MELLNQNNIIDDNKEEIILSDTHGDFTSILNVLNDYLKTELRFKIDKYTIYNDCIKKIPEINYVSINSSIIKHFDIIMNENNFFKIIKNDNLKNLHNKRLIILGDIYDPYNFRSLRKMIYDLIKLNKFNKDDKLLLDDDGKLMFNNKDIYKFGNIMLNSPNRLVLISMMMIYKLLLCLERYMEVKYIVGNHEISSFDEYPLCIKNKILNDFKCYYYNKQRNILYCHFHIENQDKNKNDTFGKAEAMKVCNAHLDTYNLLNIDDKFKEYCKLYINMKDYSFNFKKLNSIIIHCVNNKLTTNLGNPHLMKMNNPSLFQQFINKVKPTVICGHYNFKDNNNEEINITNEWDYNIYRDFDYNKLIYYIDCDMSIFHSNNFIDLTNNKKGIVLNCQYINNTNMYQMDNIININYIKKLDEYLYYAEDNEIINNENYDKNDFDKLLIFNTFDKNNIIETSYDEISKIKKKK